MNLAKQDNIMWIRQHAAFVSTQAGQTGRRGVLYRSPQADAFGPRGLWYPHQSCRRLEALPRFLEKNAVRAPGPTAMVGLAALFIGFVVGRLSSGRPHRLSNVAEGSFTSIDSDTLTQDEGATPMWLNFALGRMWALFQKNTKRLIQDVIQPVLDDSEKPDLVTDVRVTKFVPGRQSPFFTGVKRLPSRALAEVQYTLQSIFPSSSRTEFEVDVSFGKLNFTIPVTMQDLDVDARCWVSLTLAPYDPYVTAVQYALHETPKIGFDMTVAGFIPITALPILKSFFFRVVTEEIPREFLFPKSMQLDFTPERVSSERIEIQNETGRQMDELSDKELAEKHPELWSLFDAIDLDNSGSLTGVELFAGLQDWGYTAEDAAHSFAKLDLNSDNRVSFREFVLMWPKLADCFVPSKYRGSLTVYLRSAEGIPEPRFGISDPYVRFNLGEHVKESKRDSESSGDGEPGNPVWLETFDLNCMDPLNEELQLSVVEGSILQFPPRREKEIAKTKVSLESLMQRPNQRIKLKLEPQGTLRLDISYADFVTSAPEAVTIVRAAR